MFESCVGTTMNMYQFSYTYLAGSINCFNFERRRNAGIGHKLLSIFFTYGRKNLSTREFYEFCPLIGSFLHKLEKSSMSLAKCSQHFSPGSLFRRPRKGRLTSLRLAVPTMRIILPTNVSYNFYFNFERLRNAGNRSRVTKLFIFAMLIKI